MDVKVCTSSMPASQSELQSKHLSLLHHKLLLHEILVYHKTPYISVTEGFFGSFCVMLAAVCLHCFCCVSVLYVDSITELSVFFHSPQQYSLSRSLSALFIPPSKTSHQRETERGGRRDVCVRRGGGGKTK